MPIRRVLLIQPPTVVKSAFVHDRGTYSSFALGLAYVGAAARQAGFEVEVIDCFAEDHTRQEPIGNDLVRLGVSDEWLADEIGRRQPDVVGVSIPFSFQFDTALRIARLVKKVVPGVPTVAGGNHVRAAPASFDRHSDAFDFLVMGEGEETMPALLRAIDAGRDPSLEVSAVARPGIDLGAACGKKPTVIMDLDSIPMAAYDLLPMEKYWRMKGERFINMMATRGCPFLCNFCSIHTTMGRKLRRRSVSEFLAELDWIKQTYDVDVVYFEDDNLTADMKWAKRLFREIGERDYGFHYYFRNGIRADRVDRELLTLIRRAGGERIWYAPESGSQATIDNIIRKRMKLVDVEAAVKLSREVGLRVTCFLIIGFPEESLEDIQQTIDYGKYLCTIGCDEVCLSCAVPYPGTDLWQQCVELGIIDAENIDYQRLTTLDSVIYNEHFTAEEIKAIRDRAVTEINFASGPWRQQVKRRVRARLETSRVGRQSLELYATAKRMLVAKRARALS